MAFNQHVHRLFNAIINSGVNGVALTYDQFPATDDIQLTSSTTANTAGSATEIVSSVGSSEVWLYGVYLSAPSAATDFSVDIGIGDSGSESYKITVPLNAADTGTAATRGVGLSHTLVWPYHVAASTRLAGRASSGTTTADTINVNVLYVTGL